MRFAEGVPFRIGYGHDVHRFVKGRRLVLGGVEIDHEMGLEGHSDADVLLHALADALLGAAALGDIGQHFPNTDTRYKNMSSRVLVRAVAELVRSHGFTIVNVDSTLLLERPRILPHVPLMRERIAEALSIPVGRVSVKATTNEGLGFVGRGDGAVAHAVACLAEPAPPA